MSKERFIKHFFKGGSFDKTCLYGNLKTGYLLGIYKYGIFFPTRFVPKSLRGGYKMLKKLGQSNLPVIFSITEDLAKTLAKMPEWHITNTCLPSELTIGNDQKIIAHNHLPNFEKKLIEIIKLNHSQY